MANGKFRLTLDAKNLAYGAGFVVVGLALFTWLLPAVLPTGAVLTVAGAAIGVGAWFLFLISRS